MTEPYDGDPPDALIDDANSLLDSIKDRLEPILDEARAEGLSVVLLLGGYDPLTRMTHMADLSLGDYHAQIGMASRFIRRRTED